MTILPTCWRLMAGVSLFAFAGPVAGGADIVASPHLPLVPTLMVETSAFSANAAGLAARQNAYLFSSSEDEAEDKAEQEAEDDTEEQAADDAEDDASEEAEDQAEDAAEDEADLKAEAEVAKEAQQEAEDQAEGAAEEEAETAAEQESEDASEEEADDVAEEEAEDTAEQQAEDEAEITIERAAEDVAEEEAERVADQTAEAEASEEAETQAESAAEDVAQAEAENVVDQALEAEIDLAAASIAEAEASEEAETQAEIAAEDLVQLSAEEEAAAQAEEQAEVAAEQAEESAELVAQQLAENEAEESAEAAAETVAEQEAAEQADAAAELAAQQMAEEASERAAEEQAEQEARGRAERAIEEETQRAAERAAERNTLHRMERLAEEEAEKAAEQVAERRALRRARRQAEAEVEREVERAAEGQARRRSQRMAEREAEIAAERNAERYAERQAMRRAQRASETEAERLAAARAAAEAEKVADRAAEQSIEVARERMERRVNERAEAVAERLEERVADKVDPKNPGRSEAQGPEAEIEREAEMLAYAFFEEVEASIEREFIEPLDEDEALFVPEDILLLLSSEDAESLDVPEIETQETIVLKGLGMVLVRARLGDGVGYSQGLESVKASVSGATVDRNHLYESEAAPAGGLNPHTLAGLVGATGVATPTVRIGLIDTMVDTDHRAFAASHIQLKDFVPYGMPRPDAHGTAVAAIMVGDDPGQFQGLIPHAELFAASVFSEPSPGRQVATAESLVRALDWLVLNDVPVINMSLSGPRNELLSLAIEQVSALGSRVVAAVGNEGPYAKPLYPAAYPDVVAVTAVDEGRRVYMRANRGTHVDFAAPGVDVLSAQAGGGYGRWSGTSIAAPFVTTVLALQVSGGDERDLLQAVTELQASAEDLGRPGHDKIYGHGLIRLKTLQQEGE